MLHLGTVVCLFVGVLLQSAHAQVVGVVTVADGISHLIRGNDYFATEQGIDIEEGDVIQRWQTVVESDLYCHWY